MYDKGLNLKIKPRLWIGRVWLKSAGVAKKQTCSPTCVNAPISRETTCHTEIKIPNPAPYITGSKETTGYRYQKGPSGTLKRTNKKNIEAMCET